MDVLAVDQLFGPIIEQLVSDSAAGPDAWPGIRYERDDHRLYLSVAGGYGRRLCLPAKGPFKLEVVREAHNG